jgi:molybdopterin/thiamine biosynthesis adenylyltransferase
MATKKSTSRFANMLRQTRAPSSRPLILDLSTSNGRTKISQLFSSDAVHAVRDEYKSQVKELFAIENPPLTMSQEFESSFEQYWKTLLADEPMQQQGRWIYYPWTATLVHMLAKIEYRKVRTSRNRDLITLEEQARCSKATIGIAGLSIGSNVSFALGLQTAVGRIRLADFDTLALSNLNRISAGSDAIGMSKIHAIARELYLRDPYLDIELFNKGLTAKTILNFFNGLDVVIDEFDDLTMKLKLRDYAKKRKIPLISAADVGERIVIDIERYDVDPDTKPFHGHMPAVQTSALQKLSKRELGSFIARIVGLENHGIRMLNWPHTFGKEDGIISFPQLGTTALLAGTAVAFCARAIIAGWPVKNGRVVVAFDELFLTEDKDATSYNRALQDFKKAFSL